MCKICIHKTLKHWGKESESPIIGETFCVCGLEGLIWQRCWSPCWPLDSMQSPPKHQRVFLIDTDKVILIVLWKSKGTSKKTIWKKNQVGGFTPHDFKFTITQLSSWHYILTFPQGKGRSQINGTEERVQKQRPTKVANFQSMCKGIINEGRMDFQQVVRKTWTFIHIL
jgi:hypothetical protein